jgi:hypothetical protein
MFALNQNLNTVEFVSENVSGFLVLSRIFFACSHAKMLATSSGSALPMRDGVFRWRISKRFLIPSQSENADEKGPGMGLAFVKRLSSRAVKS